MDCSAILIQHEHPVRGCGRHRLPGQHDGIANLVKFATGMPAGAATQPVSIASNLSAFTFSYSRAKNAVADGIEFSIEWSASLTNSAWSPNGVVAQAPVNQGATERVTATLPPVSGARCFVRLRVTRP